MKIPGKGEVDRALKQTQRQVKSALRQVNQLAGRLVARGDYTAAQSWVDIGRSITAFGSRVEALHLEWQGLHNDAPGQLSSERTPLWKYYRPILQTLVQLGGDATISQLEEKLVSLLLLFFRQKKLASCPAISSDGKEQFDGHAGTWLMKGSLRTVRDCDGR
jgi:hypothetical protein